MGADVFFRGDKTTNAWSFTAISPHIFLGVRFGYSRTLFFFSTSYLRGFYRFESIIAIVLAPCWACDSFPLYQSPISPYGSCWVLPASVAMLCVTPTCRRRLHVLPSPGVDAGTGKTVERKGTRRLRPSIDPYKAETIRQDFLTASVL
jgi:hypothetical protein